MSRNRDALGALKRVSSDTADLFETLSRASDRTSRRGSGAVVGTLGGAVGLGAGLALSIAVQAAPFFICGPLGAVIGIPLGILIWRGPGRFNQEQRIESSGMMLDELDARIKSLPKDAPEEVRKALWAAYQAEIAKLTLSPQQLSVEGPKSQLALPAPSDQPLMLPAPSIGKPAPKKVRTRRIKSEPRTKTTDQEEQ